MCVHTKSRYKLCDQGLYSPRVASILSVSLRVIYFSWGKTTTTTTMQLALDGSRLQPKILWKLWFLSYVLDRCSKCMLVTLQTFNQLALEGAG